MHRMNYKEAFEMLRREGFTESEIARLIALRRDYGENEMDRSPADLCRLEFVRWLIATGKLTDQIA